MIVFGMSMYIGVSGVLLDVCFGGVFLVAGALDGTKCMSVWLLLDINNLIMRVFLERLSM